QAVRILSIARDVRSLHGAANRVERPARVDHAGASAIARRFRAWLWFAAGRSSFIYRRTFSSLFPIPIPGVSVGCHWKLAASESAIQGSVPDVVWVARVSFLFVSFLEQGCGAKLGWTGLPRFWTAGSLLLAGPSRGLCHPTARRGRRGIDWADHEYGGAQYGLAARGWIQVTAKRSQQPDARLEKR